MLCKLLHLRPVARQGAVLPAKEGCATRSQLSHHLVDLGGLGVSSLRHALLPFPDAGDVAVRRLRRDVWCGVFVAGHHRAREQARPLKTVNGRNRSADRPGRDRRWRDRSSGSMRELFWRNRYRLGQWPVSPRDGAARDEAQCTVRPAQAGHAGKAAAWHCECRPR